MYDVNVIFSVHQECGKCNTEELYKIIEGIRPDVIFEELDYIDFNYAYKEQKPFTLETETINKFLQNYNIEHIPVDTYKAADYTKEISINAEKFLSENSSEYKKLISIHKKFTSEYGFDFLNSKQYYDLIREVRTQEEILYKSTDNEEYKSNCAIELKANNNREIEIIKNIYLYSKEHEYNKAIFIFGVYHSYGLKKKIQEYKEEETKLNWIFNTRDLPVCSIYLKS